MAKVTFDKEKCKGCALCTTTCPKKIVKIEIDKTNSKGYYPASIEEMEECIGCGFCTLICPDVVIKIEK
jgi:2-oxoglutarate ferredoxin oxidoreductase subunit delta